MRLTKFALIALVSSSSLLAKPAWSESAAPQTNPTPEVTQSITPTPVTVKTANQGVDAGVIPVETAPVETLDQPQSRPTATKADRAALNPKKSVASASKRSPQATPTVAEAQTTSNDTTQNLKPISGQPEDPVKQDRVKYVIPPLNQPKSVKPRITKPNLAKKSGRKLAGKEVLISTKPAVKPAAKKRPSLLKTAQTPATTETPAKPSSTEQPKPATTPADTTTPATPTPSSPLDTPTTPTTPDIPSPPDTPATTTPEPQVLVGEVLLKTPSGQPVPPDIERQAYDAIATKPGRTTSRTQLQSDINAIFSTGYFADVKGDLEDTDIGVRVTFVVEVNPVLKVVQTEGASVLEEGTIDKIFSSQYGKVINLRDLQTGVKALEKYYQDKGYVLAQVADVKSQPDGTVTIVVAEGVVEDVKVGFLNEEGKTQDKDGKPITGNTRDFIITRELNLKPGQVFNRNTVQSDLQRVFGLGIFDDVNVALNPGTDPKKVVVTVNVKERSTGSIAVGAGISSATGLFGTVSFQQANLGGNNQKLGLDIQVGERDLLFDLNFTDPWLAGDPYRTSFTANIFSRRLFSYIFDNPPGAPADIGVGPDKNDTPRENRLGFGFSFSRPLGNGITASLGFRYERVTITDSNGTVTPFDGRGNQLAINPDGRDDLFLLQFAAAQDLRDDPLKTTKGSVLRFVTEQSLPFGSGSIFFNRLRASYSFYIPVKFTNFTEGPQTLAFNIQAGTIIGTLPPYEAFRIGGSNSVRGWDEGRIGSGRSYALVSAEYRFPVFSIVNGVLFADYGTDLGTGSSVPGNPAGVRGKPGSGGGYGVGVRIQSPLGAIRIDYGFATNGGTQFSFGLGEKF
ncbi:BamA/TamA family outer membrane protein [Pseudanabaena sp. PCC 6802]|uniref:BamA/TamA family outer membrane protein n=1 Tax=Pseudanabaena sp. PCC 6802 TaxID=118173 RepID=UPI0003479916|nr:BamA/TamA family outer membrane protein [Pseudanabaena sp. PCC 6802]